MPVHRTQVNGDNNLCDTQKRIHTNILWFPFPAVRRRTNFLLPLPLTTKTYRTQTLTGRIGEKKIHATKINIWQTSCQAIAQCVLMVGWCDNERINERSNGQLNKSYVNRKLTRKL